MLESTQRPNIEPPLSQGERAVSFVLGFLAVLAALYLSMLAIFLVGVGMLACDRGPYGPGEVVVGMLMTAGYALLAALAWVLPAGLLSAAAGRRGPRRRTWVIAVAVVVACAAGGVGINMAYQQPQLPPVCQTFEMS